MDVAGISGDAHTSKTPPHTYPRTGATHERVGHVSHAFVTKEPSAHTQTRVRERSCQFGLAHLHRGARMPEGNDSCVVNPHPPPYVPACLGRIRAGEAHFSGLTGT
jgi:hypothetical protein